MQSEEVPTNSVLLDEEDRPRRRWELLLLLLALLMGCSCVFCSTQLALLLWPDRLASANMLAGRQADYGGGPGGVQFGALDPLIAAQAATDIAGLQVTPAGVEDIPKFTISLLPATPTPTPKSGPPPSLPEVTRPTATPGAPTTVPTVDSTATSIPVGSPTPINSVTPSVQPTLTPVGTVTLPPPTLTVQPTATLPPPTATSPPVPSPTSTSSSDPTATSAPPTNTPTPLDVLPILESVADNGDGTCTAWWGYQNDNSFAVTLSVGSNNGFSPNPQNRLQPTTFSSGRIVNAFSVIFNNTPLVWSLDGGTATADPTGTCASYQITGRVFEDANYSGGSGTGFGGGDAGLANVQVEIYDSGNVLISSTSTDASGNYTFTVPGGSSYVVRVVSASIGDGDTPPAAGFNGGFSSAIAEQTYEHNGVSGNGGAGALGGNNAQASDLSVAAGAGPGDTNVAITVGNANVTGVDFGFAYNLIVNTQNSGQGSLRQFILNANAIAGSASSQFNIPTTDPNYNSIMANAFVIRPASALPNLTDNATTIDGTTQEANQGDLRSGLPDVVIDGDNAGANANGLTISSNSNIIRKLDIRNFNNGNGTGLVVDGGDDNTLAENYLTLNTNTSGNIGAIQFYNSTNRNIISDNTITGNFSDGLEIMSGSDNQVTNNIATDNDQDGFVLGGTSMTFTGNTAQANAPTNPLGCGIEFYTGLTDSVIADNVSSGNGGEGGICLIGVVSSNNTIGPNNIVTGNAGPGIYSPLAGSVNNRFTENEISANGGLGIDLGSTGPTANDNGDGDSGPNDLMNFPVLYNAIITGGDITITGEGRPGALIEFFLSDSDSSGYGEGQTLIGSDTITGGPAGTTDPTAQQFSFTFPAGSVVVGNRVTATATDSSDNTSEFAQNIIAN